MLTKQIKLKHGISELGNLQVYRITEFRKKGNLGNSRMEKAYTPADVNDMTGFDQKSKDIVSAITTPKVKAQFETEKQVMTGVGSEEIITHDRVLTDDFEIAVRRITRIFDNGVEKTKAYHRSWIYPGDNPAGHDVLSRVLAEKFHTPDTIAKYKLKIAEASSLPGHP